MMESGRSRIAIHLCLLALAAPALATAPPARPSPRPETTRSDAVAESEALLSAVAEQTVGLTVAVAGADGLRWSAAYGRADRRARVPATSETRMRLYSLAKPMTAVAAARLMERGELDPAAPVQAYVPEFPDKSGAITILHLANHTSGIRHYAGTEAARSSRHCETVTEALQFFADDPLVHPPGERETYSSWGYVLLSAVLEGVTGTRYETAMRELVFDLTGMTSLAIDDPGEEIPHRATFYRETEPGEFAPAETVDNTCKWGAGAWVGTAEDVALFGLAMVDGTLLQPSTEQLFLRGEGTYRAQGIGAGGMAFLAADDDNQLAVALLSNTVGESVGPAVQKAATRVHEIFTGRIPTDVDDPARATEEKTS